MKTVRNILETKGYDIWSVRSDATVLDALKLMAEKDIGALLVVDDGKMVGIFSERDYARKIILHGKTSKDTLVREIMSKKPYTIRPDQLVEECMALMTAKRIRHLPVVSEDRLIGLVSIGDVVKTVISDQEVFIEQLEDFISGNYVAGGSLNP